MRHVALCFALFAAVGSALAQVGGTGSIEGTVTDPSGAIVQGATVTAKNVATKIKPSAKRPMPGLFVLPLLRQASTRLWSKRPVFRLSLRITSQWMLWQPSAWNPRLQIGRSDQSITVEAEPTMLKTDDVVLGSSMENQVYDALPLAMNGSARDPSAFAGLAIGVNSYSTQAAGPSTGSFNGGRTFIRTKFTWKGCP